MSTDACNFIGAWVILLPMVAHYSACLTIVYTFAQHGLELHDMQQAIYVVELSSARLSDDEIHEHLYCV